MHIHLPRTIRRAPALTLLAIAMQPATVMAEGTGARSSPLYAIAGEYTGEAENEDVAESGVLPAWPDVSPAGRNKRERQLRALQARLDRLAPTSDAAEQFDRDFLREMLRKDLDAFRFDEGRIPFSNGQGFFRTLGYTANTTVIRDRKDAEDWLRRLASVPEFYDAHIANMRRGLKDGFTQPRLIVDAVLRPLQAAVATPVADDALLKPLAKLPPSIPPAEREQLLKQATMLIETQVRPAQQKTLAFMRDEYRPRARQSLAARDLPDGEAYYRFLIRKFTTTDLTPEQVHELGEHEVARILREMEVITHSLGFTGSIAEFNDALRKDPANYAASPQEYLEKASEVAKRADRAIPRWFVKLPRLTWGPVFKSPEQEGTANIYMPGSPEKGVPGSIMMSHKDATTTPLYQLAAWVVHEGVPGHHLQIALTQENEALPAFRRDARIVPFVEGWALYSESLADEMGLYRDAKERFGRLSFEMYRACRLVMDTGIHWMRWTREQAKECLARNTALSPAMVEFETDRYISQPGQALAYKIGEIRIKAIRTRAEQALGPKFDIRAFHDALIGAGAMPLDLLDRRMDAWIARQPR